MIFFLKFQNLGHQLEYILAQEHRDRLHIISDINDEAKQKQLKVEDEEEDFLNEGNIDLLIRRNVIGY